ncbi:hypothetical protein [Mariniluteicoccus flavus]
MDDCTWGHHCGGDGTPRGACLARRLLSGAGRIALFAYADPGLASLDPLAHVWSPTLRAVVVACALPGAGPGPADWPVDHGPVDVRVQIDKMAVLPDVRILAGTAHGLGSMRPLGDDELAALDARELGPLAAVVGAPGVRLVAVSLSRVLMHAGGRVEPHDVDVLMGRGAFPGDADELAVTEAVLAHGEAALARLADAVADGWWPGEWTRVAEDRPECGRLVDRVFPVDVSAHGLVMLVTAQAGAWLVTADFIEPVGSVRTLHRVLGRMLAQPTRATR